MSSGETDGKIVIEALLNTDNFKKGEKQMSSQMLDLKSKVEQTERQIESLTKELDELANTEVKSKIAESLEKDVAKAEEELNSLYAKSDSIGDSIRNNLSDLGFDKATGTTISFDEAVDSAISSNAEWKKVQDRITETEAKLSQYKAKLQEVNAVDRQNSGANSAQYAQKQEKLQQLTDKLDVYKQKMSETEKKEKSSSNTTSKSSSNMKKYKSALEKCKKVLSSFGAALKNMGKRLKSAITNASIGLVKKLGSAFKHTSSQTGALEKALGRIRKILANLLVFNVLRSMFSDIGDNFKDIASYSSDFNTKMSNLSGAFSTLKNAISAAFVPLLNVVTPILTSFMNTLTGVIDKINQFFAALSGQKTYIKATQVVTDYSEATDDSTEATEANTEAVDENQHALAGYDELNVLSDTSTSSSSDNATSSSNDDGLNYTTANVGNSISSIVEAIKEAWNSEDLSDFGKLVASKINSVISNINWNTIKAGAKKIANNIATFINGFVAGLDWTLVGTTIAEGLNTAIQFLYTLVTTLNWSNIGTAIGTAINGILKKIDASKFAKTLSNLIKGILNLLVSLVSTVDWAKFGKKIVEFIKGIDFKGLGSAAIKLIQAFAKAISDIDFAEIGEAFRNGVASIDWANIWDSVCDLTTNALKGITDFFGLKGVSTSKLNSALKNIKGDFSKILDSAKNLVETTLKKLINSVLPSIVKMLGSIMSGVSPIIDALTPILETVMDVASNIIDALAPVIEKIGQVIGTAIEALTPIITPIMELISCIIDTFAPAIEGILDVVNVVFEGIGQIFGVIGQMIDEVMGFFGMDNSEITISEAMQAELDELEEVKTGFQTITDEINAAINNSNSNISDLAEETSTVEMMRDRMNELLDQSTLSEEDMEELNTLADLISEKYPDFEETWDNYITTNEDGTLELTENQEEVQSAINDTIDKLKEQYMTEALHEDYVDLYEQQIDANKKITEEYEKMQEASNTYNDTMDKYCEIASETSDLQEAINKLQSDGTLTKEEEEAAYQAVIDSGVAYEDEQGNLINEYGNVIDASSKYGDALNALEEKQNDAAADVETAADAVKDVTSAYLEAKGTQAELSSQLDTVSDIMDVVNGKYDDSADNLQAIREAYDEGFIDDETLKETWDLTADELYAGTYDAATKADRGYILGVKNAAKDLYAAGEEISDEALQGIIDGASDSGSIKELTGKVQEWGTVIEESSKEALEIHSPSKVTYEIGEYTVEGLTDAFAEDTSTEKTITDWGNGIIKVFKTVATSCINAFTNPFSEIWDNIHPSLDNVLEGFETFFNNLIGGFNSMLSGINSINKAVGESSGENYTTYGSIGTITIPRFATGTVVPANYGEFLAVLGDNKKETEVVSPLSTLKQAMLEVMEEYGGMGNSDEQEINIYIDGDKVFNVVVNKNNRYKKTHGRSALV